MMKIKSIIIYSFLLVIASSSLSFSQGEYDIVTYLKKIEQGKADEVRKELPLLKKEHPNDPSVMFLDGVLTENAQDAISIYNEILSKYPGSKYADAALYRIYSYYYALGLYDTANSYLQRLKAEYPGSPYLKYTTQISSSDENDTTNGNDTSLVSKNISDTRNDANKIPGQFGYAIQAGAFSNEGNAKSLQLEFVKAGYYSIVKQKNVAGTIFNVVYVGQYKSEAEAQNNLQVINEKFNVDGRVVTNE
jgi:tetratricopeptide (TPR) repeat protein